MLLHFSRTVLATIIWTILLDGSAQERITEQTRVRGLDNNSISEYPTYPIDHNWKRENTVDKVESDELDDETKSSIDSTYGRIIAGDDVVENAVVNAVEERDIREYSLSRETTTTTPISPENNERNDTRSESTVYQNINNDDNSSFQHRSKASSDLLSSKENIDVAGDTVGGVRFSEKHGSNISRKAATKDAKMENDNVASNGFSSNDIVYMKGALKLAEILNSSVSLIVSSNTSGVNTQRRNSSFKTRSSESYDSTSGSVSKARRSSDRSKFMVKSSLNDDSSQKYRPLGRAKESLKNDTTREHGKMLSTEMRDALFFRERNIKIENDSEGKTSKENMLTGNNRNSIGGTSTMPKKVNIRSIARLTRKNTVNDQASDLNEIFEYGTIDKTRKSRQRKDSSSAFELQKIAAANKQESTNAITMKQKIPKSPNDSGVSGSFTKSVNFLGKMANQAGALPSMDNANQGFTTPGEISRESLEKLSGQIREPANARGRQVEMSSSTSNIDEVYEHTTARYSLERASYSSIVSESQHLKKPHSLALEVAESYQQREQKRRLKKINYLENERDERRSFFASSLNDEASETNGAKAWIAGENEAEKKKISGERSFREIRNNERVIASTTQASYDNGISPSNREFVDNPTRPDTKTNNHGNVVKTELTGSHKTFIGQKYNGGIDLRSYRKEMGQERVQERGKHVQKVYSDTRPMEMNGSVGRKDKARYWREPLVNSEASSPLWLVVKRGNDLLDSIASVTTGGTRKIEFSGRDEGPQEQSRRIGNIVNDDNRKRIIFSKELTAMVPRSAQFTREFAMEYKTSGDDSAAVEKREHLMEKIYQPARTDESFSRDFSPTEVDPWEHVPDADENDRHSVRGDDGETTEVLGSLRSQLPRDNVFYQRRVNDPRGKISSDIRDKSPIRGTRLATQLSNATATSETYIRPVNSSKVRSDIRRDKSTQSKNAKEDNSVAKNPQDRSIFLEFVRVLSKGGINKTIRSTVDDMLDDETRKRDDHPRANERFALQGNYIRERKIEKTNEISIVNRLKLPVSARTDKVDSPEIERDTKNHSNHEILNVDICETCEIFENMDRIENYRAEKLISGNSLRRSGKKIVRSINDAGALKNMIPIEITKKSGVSVDPNFIVDAGNSLANTSVEFETIHHSRPEERIDERMQWKNTRALMRDQQTIINESEVMNSIVSRERTSALRNSSLNIEKLNSSNQVLMDKATDRRNESLTLSSPKVETREPSSRIVRQTHSSEARDKTNIGRFTEAFANERITQLSNNTSDISGDPENFMPNSSFSMGSVPSSDRSWKSLVPDDETTSSMSSRKIDGSVGSFERPSYQDGFSRRKYFTEHSQSDIRPSEILGDIAKLSNTRTKEIKKGFTKNDDNLIFFKKATTKPAYVYESFLTTKTKKAPNAESAIVIDDDSRAFEPSVRYSNIIETVKSSTDDDIISKTIATIPVPDPTNTNFSNNDTQNYRSIRGNLTSEPSSEYSRLNENDEPAETHQVLVNKMASSMYLADPTNVSFPVTNGGDHDSAFVRTLFVQDNNNSSNESSRVSGRLELPRKQLYETVENARGSADTRTLNQTIHDNLTRITAALNQWPVKHSAVVEGDLVLGGLMMVHEREDSVTCGPVMPQGGVQALEAMLYTLDWLNKRDLVPGVKIGAHILDDCDKDTYGLEMAVDFIKGSISNIDGAEYHCNKTAVRKVISGVVGAASSVTSIQVANLLRLFRIPQVSFFSTSPELSNKMRFEYFTRTIPSDHYQVKAMVDIVLVMGWSYVSIIYEESNYGEKAYEELEKLLGKHQICIAVKEKLSKDSGVAKAHVYDHIVQKLLTKPRARGCIIFASDQEVAGVMRAVRRCNATGAFSWIGSDGWSARSLVSDGNEREMEGTLSVQPQANPVEGFEDYFLNLTVENNRRNPWFVEFWEDHFKCRYPNSSQTPYNNYTVECTTTERLAKENTAFEDQLQYVSDAVLAFSYALRNMHEDLCGGKPGLCDAMKPTKGTELLSYLRNVKFNGLSGDVFHFDKNGDGPARYNIIHFKQVSPGEYKWIRVGKYLEGELRLNMSEIQFRLGNPQAPESVCSLPCEIGQAKKYVEGESCCWHCFNCSQDEIRHVSDEKQCVLCPKGTLPDETHSYCRDIPEEFLRPESGWAIGAMSFSSTGILITLFVGGVFLKHNDTPIVRASGRELSYVLLTGILLCYLVTFALVLRPTDLVCSIQRFSAGICFTVMYAALLTKTNRISRIFNAGKRSAKRPSFISPRSQIIICSMLVGIQILINVVWMIIDPAKARHHYPTREDNLLVCNSYIDASYMIAFTYPIILIVVCTVYAVLTRKIPEAFNESKHIGFTMYTTCVIWLAFVPLYFATGSHVALRITSMSVTISLSATVTIACLFTPKLYIILIHPERNVRPNMMHHKYNTTKGSVVTATNASSMMAPVTLTAITCDQNKAVKKHVITTIDCSTQSDQFELELKERKNGKLPASLTTRSTQTLLNNNGKDSSALTSPVNKDIGMEENICPSKLMNVGKIGNGPLSQNEVPL